MILEDYDVDILEGKHFTRNTPIPVSGIIQILCEFTCTHTHKSITLQQRSVHIAVEQSSDKGGITSVCGEISK